MGTIKKTQNGTYEVRYCINNEKGGVTQRKKRFKKKKQADDYLKKVIADIENQTYVQEVKITLCEYLDTWLNQHKKNIAITTYEGYVSKINHMKNYIGHIELQKLKPIHINQFYSSLHEDRNMSNNTIVHVHRILSKALSAAYKLDLIKTNPCSKIDLPKQTRHQGKFLELKEVTILLEQLRGTQIFIPVLLAVMLGLRRGEVLGLKWENVNFESGTLEIKDTVTRLKTIVAKDTKTQKSHRKLFMGKLVEDELKKEIIRQKEQRLKFGNHYIHNNYVCKHEDGAAFEPSLLSLWFKKHIRSMEITKVTFHELRHTNATLMLSAGISPKLASERLGHSTIKITMDLYTHFMDSANKEVADKLDALVGTK